MRLFNFRLFACLAAACALYLQPAPSAHDHQGIKVGMQTWTLRNLNFDQMVEFCVKHDIKYLQIIANHVDPKAPREEIQRKKEILEKNGLIPYTFGVAGTSLDKEENRKLFEFAKFMGMKMIVVEPNDFKIVDILEELAKEYQIRVVIHNHGIHSLYGNPLVVRNLIKHRDPLIGVCMDAGWIASARLNPDKVFKEYEGRVYDIHLKDKYVECTDQGDRATDTFLGEGDANLTALLQTLQEARWNGVIAIETDKNLKDPTEHTEKALRFIKSNLR